jgi:hypothetical protein
MSEWWQKEFVPAGTNYNLVTNLSTHPMYASPASLRGARLLLFLPEDTIHSPEWIHHAGFRIR